MLSIQLSWNYIRKKKPQSYQSKLFILLPFIYWLRIWNAGLIWFQKCKLQSKICYLDTTFIHFHSSVKARNESQQLPLNTSLSAFPWESPKVLWEFIAILWRRSTDIASHTDTPMPSQWCLLHFITTNWKKAVVFCAWLSAKNLFSGVFENTGLVKAVLTIHSHWAKAA